MAAQGMEGAPVAAQHMRVCACLMQKPHHMLDLALLIIDGLVLLSFRPYLQVIALCAFQSSRA